MRCAMSRRPIVASGVAPDFGAGASRSINVTDAVVDEISTTIDVSRAGILFLSTSPNYARGMEVAVIFPYSTAPALHAEQPGRIVRAFATSDGRYAVAVALGEGVGEDIVDSCGRKLADSSPAPRMPMAPPAAPLGSNGSGFSLSREPNSKRPLVLVVDADEMIRATLKAYLSGEGYDVMAVSNCLDAREVMNMFTPALVIAEVEGEGLPGYDLCAHVKQSPRLKHVPVVLTDELRLSQRLRPECAFSSSAVVCMSKPLPATWPHPCSRPPPTRNLHTKTSTTTQQFQPTTMAPPLVGGKAKKTKQTEMQTQQIMKTHKIPII